MRQLLALIVVGVVAFAGDTVLSKPIPTIENPRKIAIEINSADEKIVSGAIATVNNLIKAYGMGYVEIAVVVYGPALNFIKKSDAEITKRFETLGMMDVEIIACRNTMTTYKLKESDLIDGIETVQAGLQEIVEKQLSGWVHLKP